MINGIAGSGYDTYAGAAGVGAYGKDAHGSGTYAAAINGQEEKNGNNVGGECETCKSRKYQDGSNEMVSFKSAAHISPDAAATAVRAHEGEHVSNAYTKAAQKDGKVINASVQIFTSTCPECGRTYVSGGVTNTAIKYSNEENPYMKNFKAQQAAVLTGQNVDRKE